MINLSRISNKHLFGQFLRLPLRLIPKSLKVKIIQGYNKGFYWVAGSGVNGYWIGSYEWEKQNAIKEYCKDGFVAYDIGAHVGFYTLLFSRFVGGNGFVYAFEPNCRNLVYLYTHLQLNKIQNVRVIPVALGKVFGYKYFDTFTDSSMSHISNKQELTTVVVDTIDRLLFKEKIILPPSIIKIDVEGSEFDVLNGMKDTIKQYRPIILLAIDNPEKRPLVIDFLSTKNYSINKIGSSVDEIIALP